MEILTETPVPGSSSSAAPPKRISLSGKILIGLTGGIAIGASIVCYPFVAPAFRQYCLPYVPATTTQVTNILAALRHRHPGGKLLDIGSGDGRIVLAAARQGFQADGVELNPWLVQYSRLSALTGGVSAQTAFYRRDLWTFDLSPYRNIVIFGVEQMVTSGGEVRLLGGVRNNIFMFYGIQMEELERKLQREVTDADSQIIVCRFPLPNVMAHTVIGGGVDTVWVYDLRKQPPHQPQIAAVES